MHPILKLILFVVALALCGAVFYLGYLANNDASFVILFGLACAFFVPTAIELFRSVFRSSDASILERLAKVAELEGLMEKAATYEEKLNALKNEYAHIEEIINLESRRLTMLERRKNLENEAMRILDDLEALDSKWTILEKEIENGNVKEEIAKLRARISPRNEYSMNGLIRFEEITISLPLMPFSINLTKLNEALIRFWIKIMLHK